MENGVDWDKKPAWLSMVSTVCGDFVLIFVLWCYRVVYSVTVLSSFAIIFMGKRELVALPEYCSSCADPEGGDMLLTPLPPPSP